MSVQFSGNKTTHHGGGRAGHSPVPVEGLLGKVGALFSVLELVLNLAELGEVGGSNLFLRVEIGSKKMN